MIRISMQVKDVKSTCENNFYISSSSSNYLLFLDENHYNNYTKSFIMHVFSCDKKKTGGAHAQNE